MATPELKWCFSRCQNVTVAILAQGTTWAGAVTQAFLLQVRVQFRQVSFHISGCEQCVLSFSMRCSALHCCSALLALRCCLLLDIAFACHCSVSLCLLFIALLCFFAFLCLFVCASLLRFALFLCVGAKEEPRNDGANTRIETRILRGEVKRLTPDRSRGGGDEEGKEKETRK